MHSIISKNITCIILIIALICSLIIGSVFFYNEPIQKFEETRIMMDTYVTVTIYHGNEDDAIHALGAAFDRMDEIVTIASTWNESAEAYQLNENNQILAPSEELLDLIEKSIHFYEITDGCFDITIQPLLDLWEFKQEAEQQFWELNASDQLVKINETMPFIGSDKIEIHTSPSSINLNEGMNITLGGIAKGYIVDAGLQVLDDMGFEHVLINAGGDIASIGGKPKMPWTIALENPENRDDYITRFKIQGKAVATSGNYLRYYNESEKIGHIMDPKTGYSVDTCWSSTIIANNCTYADSLATSVFVLGPLKGMQLIESLNDIEGLIIDAESKIHRSSGLDEFEY